MSTHNINGLFEQIVQSEEKIKKRFEELKKVGGLIQESQEQIRCTKYESELVKGKITAVNHKLLQEEIQKDWLETRKTILHEQKEKCLKEKEDVIMQLEVKRLQHRESRIAFLDESDSLLKKHASLCLGENTLYSEGNLDEKLKVLTQEHLDVTQSIEACLKREEEKKLLEEKLIATKKANIFEDKEALVETKKAIYEEVKRLEGVKHNVSKMASTDPDFRCVLQEMENSKEECALLSKRHDALAKELYELQQKPHLVREYPRVKQDVYTNPWTVTPKQTSHPSYSKRVSKGRRMFCYDKNSNQDMRKKTNTSNGTSIVNGLSAVNEFQNQEKDVYFGSPSFDFFTENDDILLDDI